MDLRSLMRSARAGLAYFGIVFAAGFVLGTVRVLAVAPRIGESTAVLIEAPIMLALSWSVCRWLVSRFDIPETISARLVMGGLAFAVLFFAEMAVSVLGFGRTPLGHLEQYREVPSSIGLFSQIAFALFPVLQRNDDLRVS